MERKKKLSQSEIDGVQYRRVPTWCIAIAEMQGGAAMAFYSLVGLMSYVASEGYGIALAVAGVILTATRWFDGLIDPFLAVWIDKLHTRFGKLRILMLLGLTIRSIAMLMLFVWFSGRTDNVVLFIVLYMVNIVGNSIFDIAGNMLPAVMTNDPRQRPTVQVWATIYNYIFPTVLAIVSVMIILPMFGNQYTREMLSLTCIINVTVAWVLTLIACIGLTPVDKPENFMGITAGGDDVSLKDMGKFLAHNRPFQMYVIAAVSDKLAQQVNSQTIVSTLLFGILIGNIQFGTLLSTFSMLPSIVFAIFGARYCGKHGSREATVTWTWVCTIVAVISVVFCAAIDMRSISTNIVLTVVFFVLLLLMNGAKMCVTTANGSMRADIVDFELDRSGKYIPGIVTATYNFIDQLVSSLGVTIATLCVAAIGYVNTVPQPTDAATPAIKFMALFLYFGMPLLGWICTLIAMRFYKLTKQELVGVQKRIAEKKAAVLAEKQK
ncbi:MAG: MFS transporter [Subdoligranulum variabile]|nr:MAG: MFS transporter [Subdoligranulum variabile]